ncbi:MAG: YfcE family phosphodiesterase, partial [bacterium]|nr:YfcE family phosphodiesterase [bacterium]
MKIAILSDSHDNIKNLEKTLAFCKKKKIQKIIHCGDVTKAETLKFIKNSFEGKIFLSLGNADLKEEILSLKGNLDGVFIFENLGEIEINNLKIGFCHSSNDLNELIQKKEGEEDKSSSPPIAGAREYDFFFFGHTHKPSLKKNKKCYLA